MGYYDPPDYRDWEADFGCPNCEKDTLHFWTHQVGSTMTYATCIECDTETELHPDDFED